MRRSRPRAPGMPARLRGGGAGGQDSRRADRESDKKRSAARSPICSLRPGSRLARSRQSVQTIERISDIATSISGAVEQQRAATQNIAQSVRSAAAGRLRLFPTFATPRGAPTKPAKAPTACFTSAKSLSAESLRLKAEVDNPRRHAGGLIGRLSPSDIVAKLPGSRFVDST